MLRFREFFRGRSKPEEEKTAKSGGLDRGARSGWQWRDGLCWLVAIKRLEAAHPA